MACAELNEALDLDSLRFDGLSVSTSTADGVTAESSDAVHTPGDSSVTADESNIFLSNESIAKRWEEALSRCKKKLKDSDFHELSSYDSPEKLLEELERFRIEHSEARFIDQVGPAYTSFKEAIGVFIAVMLPRNVTTGFLWGVFYLMLKLSAPHREPSKFIASTLGKMRNQLKQLTIYAQEIGNTDETRYTLVNVFEAIIHFWVKCVSHLRTKSSGEFKTIFTDIGLARHPSTNKAAVDLQDSFKDTLYQIEQARDHLKQIHALYTAHRAPLTPIRTSTEVTEFFPVHLLPHKKAKELFVGRVETMGVIQDLSREASCRDELFICSIWGLAGVGKTEIALQYAQMHLPQFDAVLWARSESEETLKQEFTKFALELQLSSATTESNPDHTLHLVHRWFRTTNRKWLLIFDNVEKYKDIERYIPTSKKGTVLITTRYETQAKIASHCFLQVMPLNHGDAKALFAKIIGWVDFAGTPKEDEDAVDFLIDQMGGLVVGIQQFAALMNWRGWRPSKMAETYRKQPLYFYDKTHGSAGHTLNTLWKITFDMMKSNPSYKLLGVLSCIRPDEIPITLFIPSDITIIPADYQVCGEELEVEAAIDELKAAGLIERSMPEETLSLHRLIQGSFLLYMDSKDRQQAFEAATALVNHAFPTQIKGRPLHMQWSECRTYIDHGVALAETFGKLRSSKLVQIKSSDTLAELLSNCTWYLSETGGHQQNLDLLKLAYDACSDKDGLLYAHLLNSAAQSHFELNDLGHCRQDLEKSRLIREAVLSPNDEELANTYLNLGNLETAAGNMNAALELFKKADKIREPLPEAAQMLAVAQLCRGRALFLQGNNKLATERYDHCESIFLKTIGPTGYSMAGLHFARGNLQLDARNYNEAKVLFEKALEILLEKTPVHIKVAATYYKIGCTQLGMKKYREALEALQKALTIARIRGALGMGEEARILRKEAIALEKGLRDLPPDEHAVIISLSDLKEPDILREEADRVRRKLQGSSYQQLADNEEGKMYDRLVGGFHR